MVPLRSFLFTPRITSLVEIPGRDVALLCMHLAVVSIRTICMFLWPYKYAVSVTEALLVPSG
jgi:hypothetical protein